MLGNDSLVIDRFEKIILEQANRQIDRLEKHLFIRGDNGPYHDDETTLRVAAHWICIFGYLYKKYADERYRDCLVMLADHILDNQQANNTFKVRNKESKDKVNGTIGHAWIIEGLLCACEISNDERYYDSAVRCFKTHVFSEEFGVWNRIEIDGSNLGIDYTFNHQLWLAAAGALICKHKVDNRICFEVESFLEKSKKNLRIYHSGLIKHELVLQQGFSIKDLLWNSFFLVKKCFNLVLGKPSLKYKEEGYHFFNVYGMAILYNVFPNHSFFHCRKFEKVLEYCLKDVNWKKLLINEPDRDSTGLAKTINCSCNIYGFSYNSPAFELPFIYKEFGIVNKESIIDELLKKQLELTYDEKSHDFSCNTEDGVVLVSRIYELLR